MFLVMCFAIGLTSGAVTCGDSAQPNSIKQANRAMAAMIHATPSVVGASFISSLLYFLPSVKYPLAVFLRLIVYGSMTPMAETAAIIRYLLTLLLLYLFFAHKALRLSVMRNWRIPTVVLAASLTAIVCCYPGRFHLACGKVLIHL